MADASTLCSIRWLSGLYESRNVVWDELLPTGGDRIGERKRVSTKQDLNGIITEFRAYLALNAHHRHNKPPRTMLTTIAVMLPTIHNMNKS